MSKPALPDIKDFTLRVKICFMTDRAYITYLRAQFAEIIRTSFDNAYAFKGCLLKCHEN